MQGLPKLVERQVGTLDTRGETAGRLEQVDLLQGLFLLLVDRFVDGGAIVQEDDGLRRKVVQQSRWFIGHRREEKLKSGLGLLRRFGQMPPPGRSQQVRQSFPGRRDRDLVESLERTLALRVEPPQRIDLVAEKLEPSRRGLRRRPHIEDASTAAELALFHDERFRAVTRPNQFRQQTVIADGFTPAEDAGMGLELRRRQRAGDETL